VWNTDIEYRADGSSDWLVYKKYKVKGRMDNALAILRTRYERSIFKFMNKYQFKGKKICHSKGEIE
jgi:hypothetical protein